MALYLLAFNDPLDQSPGAAQLSTKPSSTPALYSRNDQWSAGAMEIARCVPVSDLLSNLSLFLLPSLNKLDSRLPKVLALISFLPMITKQVINVIQLVNASRWLAEGDIAERQSKAKQP